MRESRGCDKNQPMLNLPFAPSMLRCPRSQIDPDAWQHVNNWQRWRTMKWLPYGGTIDEQPLYIAEGIEAAQTAFDAYHGRQAKAAAVKAGNG